MEEQEIARLERLLDEEQRRNKEDHQKYEEEQRRWKEEDQQYEEEERRRETEILTGRPHTVKEYLESCHRLNLAIKIVTEKAPTTQGEATNPTGCRFPRRIIPWESFAASQEETWNQLAADDAFLSNRALPSLHLLEYVASLNNNINSEIDLRFFERDTVENAVRILLHEVDRNPRLRIRLGMQGTVSFEYPDMDGDERSGHSFICRTVDGRKYPSLTIEYKAPQELTGDHIAAGLTSEVQPERDAINIVGEGFEFESKRLCAAVITQVFSHMIGLGTLYGYICTGEAFIFLHIDPSDPSAVYYSVQVPNLDVMEDDEKRLHRTAVSQVFAFVLRSICEELAPKTWFDATEELDKWTV